MLELTAKGLGLLALCVLLVLCFQSCDRIGCWKLGSDSQIETKYTMFNGCMVKTEKGFVPKDHWRAY
jgi:hypothetical protein